MAAVLKWMGPLTDSNLIGLAYSYVYAISILVAGQVLRSYLKVPQDITRKFVHIAAGSWVWATVALFDSWQWGIVPFVSFVFVNYFLYRARLLSAIDSPDNSPGTVYFALVISLLFGILWRPRSPEDQVHVALAGVMALTWGDALAAVVGIRWGKHRFCAMPGYASIRSIEGSVVMFMVSTLVVTSTLIYLSQGRVPAIYDLQHGEALFAGVISASFATAVEAISPWGMDNILIPLSTAGLLVVLLPAPPAAY
jgi:phytol kinase